MLRRPAFLLAIAMTAAASSLRSGDVLPIEEGAVWRFFKGTHEPPANWNKRSFDDSGWLLGATSIGFGTAETTTLLEDMQGTYVSVFARRSFSVPSGSLSGLTLTVHYDDGFVAYVNGVEVGRANLHGSPPPFDATATEPHNVGEPRTMYLHDLERFHLGDDNVLALQVHNRRLTDRDAALIATLAISDCHSRPQPTLSYPVNDFRAPARRVDLDGDGAKDLVAADGHDETLVVLRNRSDGTFAERDSIPLGMVATGLVVGDFDLDGNVDAIASGHRRDPFGSFRMRMARGDGRGSFEDSQPLLSSTRQFVALTTGDLDGDGTLDLAAATNPSSFRTQDAVKDLRVWLHRDGRFELAAVHTIGRGLQGSCRCGLVVADVDGDGIEDLIGASSSGLWLLRTDDFELRTLVDFPARSNTNRLTTGDIDTDGDIDIINSNAFGSVSVYRNLGDGTFLRAEELTRFQESEEQFPKDLALADVDDDAHIDLLALRVSGNGRAGVSVFKQLADGHFAARAQIDVRSGGSEALEPGSLFVDDLNGDETPDVVAASRLGVSVLLNEHGSLFADPAESLATPGILPSDVHVRDLNGDGALDVAALDRIPGKISIFTNLGNGQLVPHRVLDLDQPDEALPRSLIASDLDSDGRPDFAATSDVGVHVFFNDAEDFVRSDLPDAAGPCSLRAGDFDGDGTLDLASVSAGEELLIYRGLGERHFGKPRVLPHSLFFCAPIELGDLDRDGRLDVAAPDIISGGGEVRLLFNRGEMTFEASTLESGLQGSISVKLADVNQDGELDLIAAGVRRDASERTSVAVHLNLGAGELSSPDFFAAETQLLYDLVDFDADGDLDVLGPDGNALVVLFNSGDGSFARKASFSSFPNWIGGVAWGDLNGNGRGDLVATTWGSLWQLFHQPPSVLAGLRGGSIHVVRDPRWDPGQVGGVVDDCQAFLRGDCDGDGRVGGSVADAIYLLNYTFRGGPRPPCVAACDADGDGEVGGSPTDAIYLLTFAFEGGSPPVAPFPECDQPSTPSRLTCVDPHCSQ